MDEQKRNEQRADILEHLPIKKAIWKLSIPSLIGILSYNLYNIINMIYIARGVGTKAAGGLAVTFPLFLFLAALSSTLGAGASSIISRAIGEKNIEKANQTAANTFLIFWISSIAITLFGLLSLDKILYVMGVTNQLMPYARDYTKIVLIGAITSTGFSSLIRAEGSTIFAMYQWIIPIVLNIILDPILIFALHLGIRGAAIATVSSQCVSTGMFLHYYFIGKKTLLNLKIRHFLPNLDIIKEICAIGIPSFLQMIGQSVTMIAVNNILKSYQGDLYISAYGIVNKIVVFLIIPIQGLLQGMQPMIGYNYGAKISGRVKETLNYTSIVAGVYGFVCCAFVMLFSQNIIFLFTKDEMLIPIGSRILKIICLGLSFLSVQMIQTTYFQAIGKSKISLFLSLCNYFFCFIPILYFFSVFGGLKLMWFAVPVSNILTFCISSTYIILCKK